jgi:Xaa-Pro aminopeptidase
LHYVENNQQCKSGDLILIDAGAEYANYSSDMTRTIQFQENTMTDKSRLQCRFTREATKMLVPGTLWKQYHIEVEINDFRTTWFRPARQS